MAHNLRLIRQIRELEHKARRLDVLVDDELIFAFYERLIPPDVNTGVSFERWRAEAERSDPKLLFLSRDELMTHQAAGVTTDLFPKQMALQGMGGELRLPLDYHFEPGSPRDGVTVTVPLIALNQIDAEQCEWLVPGMLKEKVQLLLKSLPQKLRRHLVPLPDYSAAFTGRAGAYTSQSLIGALISDVRNERSLVCQPADFKRESLPAHLQMNFKVVDEHGRQLAMGRNLAQLRAELGGQVRATFQRVAQREAVSDKLHDRIVDWDFGKLPEVLELQRDGQALLGYPALVDHVTHCSIEVFDTPARADLEHRAGLRRLFRLVLKDQVRFLEKSLANLQMTQVRASTIAWLSATFPSYDELREQIITAALDRTCLAFPLPTDRASFVQRKEEARGKVSLIAQELARLIAAIVEQAATIARRLTALKAFPRLVADVEQQLSQLFAPQFIVTHSAPAACALSALFKGDRVADGQSKRRSGAGYREDQRTSGAGAAVAARGQCAQGCQRPPTRRVPLAARGATRFAFRSGIKDADAGQRQALAKILGKREPVTWRRVLREPIKSRTLDRFDSGRGEFHADRLGLFRYRN